MGPCLWRGASRLGCCVTLALAVGACGLQRSPVRLARQVSGLDVPATARVLDFRDEPSGFLHQDLFARVELELAPHDVAPLLAQARARGYREIRSDDGATPADAPPDSPNQFGVTATGREEAAAELAPGSAGVFRYDLEGPAAYALTVLDSARRRLVVQVVIL